eukprot:sb/3471640/
MISKESCIYTSCYCEENVYKLIESWENRPRDLHAVFITNALKQCPIWQQESSSNPAQPVIWDYHVIAATSTHVFDLDTRLPFPCDLEMYLQQSFKPDEVLNPVYMQKLRPIAAEDFLKTFSSDRRHMKKDGEWLSEPPTYAPIFNPSLGHNLSDLINCTDRTWPWLDVNELSGHLLARCQ